MESITKEEVQKFLWDQGITPHAANFEGAVIEFILRKFNILSFEVEDTAYKILKSDVQKFQWKLQANAKRKTPKERLIKLHRVRHLLCNLYPIFKWSKWLCKTCLDQFGNL